MLTEWCIFKMALLAGFFHPEGAKISCFAKKSWVDFLPFLRFVSFGFFLSFFCWYIFRLPVSMTDQKEFLCCYDLFENCLVKGEKVLFWKLEWIDQVSVYWFVTDILL